MRNLARLNGAANRIGPHVKRRVDRRKLPVCAQSGCKLRVEALSDGQHIEHCYHHASEEEKQRYQESWFGPGDSNAQLLDLLSAGMQEGD